ncbi:NAD(P)-binding protein [Xylaria sp. FL1042]|nr:NAD(P)-binding protein [Xylaria sp. FL1042]
MPTAKSVLVTGCSVGGIGAALALTLADRGYFVFATARNTSKIPDDVSSLPNVKVLELDVSSTESVVAAAKAVKESGHGLDVLVNNAGVGYAMPILDIDIDKAQDVYNTNVFGVIRTVQAFSDMLIESRGRVVNISTIGAVLNMPWISTYSSSKASLASLSEALRLELSPFGVDVVTIMGGIVDSRFHENDEFKLPSTSRYAPIQDTIASWASGASKPEGMTVEDFAKHVLPDIIGAGSTGVVWRGPNAGSARIANSLMPASVMDWSLSQGQGLEELKTSVSESKPS